MNSSRTKEMFNGMTDGTVNQTRKFEGPAPIKLSSQNNKFSPNANKRLPGPGTR
jgi:hypothetical protein